MDFRDLVMSEDWKTVYDKLLEMWKFNFRNAAKETDPRKHLQYLAKVELIEEIMQMPIKGLKDEEAVLYKKKLNKDQDKFLKERLDNG
jgi:predicted DNA-binding ArsR family transcriptional regulator